MTTVGFTGSRQYPRPDLVESFVMALARKYPDTTIVSGGRGAVDTTAEQTGLRCGLEVVSYVPTDTGILVRHWEREATEAREHPMLGHNNFVRNCFFRNEFIAECERVVGFWDLASRGTADTLKKAEVKGRPRTVYDADGLLLTEEDADGHVRLVLG